ncbi:hypothetical protein PG993_003436 [Apiospora rasikravindrae]|uniref:Zn(2)-C6 fungal-type domain-containing protein n=1 Tax=Apiospora rasikravindrae TaxID=990691 RepID=A0ABR1TZH6_9PEZI
MLSNPLQRFSPYHSLPANTLLSNAHVPTSHLHAAGLDAFGHGSQYSLQHLQQHVGVHAPHLARAPQPKHRQHPYGGQAPRATGAAGPIRRRISRACDQCNQLRTKCDGQHPCAHCIGRIWTRLRIHPRKEEEREGLAQRPRSTSSSTGSGSFHPERTAVPLSGENDASTEQRHDNSASSKSEQQSIASEKALNELNEDSTGRSQRTGSLDSLAEISSHQPHLTTHHATMDRDHLDSPTSLDLNGFGNVQNPYDRQGLGAHMMAGPTHTPYGASQTNLSDYPDIPYTLQTQNPANYATKPLGELPHGGKSSERLPHGRGDFPWMDVNIVSPSAVSIAYPTAELSSTVAVPSVESSDSSSGQHNPSILGLRPDRPLLFQLFVCPCSPHVTPALLASMLWVAAQTSDASFLTSVPSARGKICQKLLELTVSLLKPLIHTPSGEASPVSSPPIDGVALGGLGVAMPGSMSLENLSGESGAFGAAGSLDDVITYIHLATVVSASEYKGASLRWWNAAWSLARELKLGRELPLSASMGQTDEDGNEINTSDDGEDELGGNIASGSVTDEEREERRRIWWLTYIVDRHLALCYNRPLFLLDIECEGLMQPMDDTEWQNGNFRSNVTDPALPGERVRGPHFECTGHSIFGYFLPLMTILGEIVDLHHARNHPRFGVGFRSAREWDDQAAEITRHLEMYERSLKQFEQQHFQSSAEDKNEQSATLEMPSELDHLDTVSVRSIRTNSSRMTESDIQTRIVMSYGTHVMHVLHILLTGKWDPINLLDDNDLWISSQGFITATGHAVSAAEAISNILEFDPGLEFMPFFFGIYLLQGSFLLLLIADKLQLEASASVVRACETIIRAHEACMVTLSTEYQRNFSKVMRSALAQVRGRVPEDLHEQHQRRRELLALYRWTGDGTGLAL